MTGAAVIESDREVIDAQRGTPRMVHVAFLSTPGRALCGATTAGIRRFDVDAPDCVVCAELDRALGSGVGE